MATLEHVNITVSDPARTAALMTKLFDWKIRWQGPSMMGGHSIHVGTDDAYIAVYGNGSTPANGKLNHVGVVVDDLASVEQRVVDAGYTPHSHYDYEPGRRFYFNDHDGVEFEIVSYT